jgi:hypothetical protein
MKEQGDTSQTAKEAAAIRTLERLGYTYGGGVEWRPPLGPARTFAELPASVPRESSIDMPAYIARLWLEAGRRRREAARLQNVVLESIAKAERIEALARRLEAEMANGAN